MIDQFSLEYSRAREKYAELIKTMLIHSVDYRRIDSRGAFVLAIDSQWGTGKTVFVKFLKNHLENKVNNGSDEQEDIINDSKFNVIYYNSWDADYWDNALDPLIDSILSSRPFEVELQENEYSDLKIAAIELIKGVGLAYAKSVFGEVASTLIEQVIGVYKDPNDNPIELFQKKRKQYDNFKAALKRVIDYSGKQLVIIIDELDRCRPLFAIQTLELAKHIFDVEGVSFVFALDIMQLSCAIKTIYGEGMDAYGYLNRFFDYISRLPIQSKVDFIKVLLLQVSCFTKIDNKSNQIFSIYNSMVNHIDSLSRIFGLSFRDISSLLLSYKLLCDAFLDAYLYELAHRLYFSLLVIKLKDPDAFFEIFLDQKNIDFELSSFGSPYNRASIGDEFALIKRILCRNRIGDEYFMAYRRRQPLYQNRVKVEKIRSNGNPTQSMITLKDEITEELYTCAVDEYFNLDGVLFPYDLKKWNSIESYSLCKYYHIQIEMFESVLSLEKNKKHSDSFENSDITNYPRAITNLADDTKQKYNQSDRKKVHRIGTKKKR